MGDPEGETFSFEGTHYQLTDSPALPKPAQQPRPPVIVGGAGARRTPRLAARFAYEYNAPFHTVQDSAAAFSRVREACQAAGRDPSSVYAPQGRAAGYQPTLPATSRTP